MPTLNLSNITIKKLEDKNFKTYFLIVNNYNSDEAYFCLEGTVKSGWDDLANNWEKIKEVELEFEEQEKGFKTYKKWLVFMLLKVRELLSNHFIFQTIQTF